nr:hypothetical protein GCM10020093_035470 [Planobispora longispora]
MLDMSSSRHDHALPPARVEEISDGVYAYIQPDGSWWINNTGFLAGRRGVISVDSCATERRTLAYREAIRSVTDRPVTTLVNTHHHGDHTFGNSAFPEATVVGHEQTRERIIEEGVSEYLNVAWTPVEWGISGPTRPSSPTPTGSPSTPTTCAARSGTWASRRTPPTTRSCGSRSGGCCSPGTWSSTAARRSC